MTTKITKFNNKINKREQEKIAKLLSDVKINENLTVDITKIISQIQVISNEINKLILVIIDFVENEVKERMLLGLPITKKNIPRDIYQNKNNSLENELNNSKYNMKVDDFQIVKRRKRNIKNPTPDNKVKHSKMENMIKSSEDNNGGKNNPVLSYAEVAKRRVNIKKRQACKIMIIATKVLKSYDRSKVDYDGTNIEDVVKASAALRRTERFDQRIQRMIEQSKSQQRNVRNHAQAYLRKVEKKFKEKLRQ
uniref:BHLH domain-containing protein n=1 Tax=Strongyloides venezuelensis TaxID=75913 RepID=A0A0K0FTC7_STRVS